jgi:DsbC/DsbD-like thiol-disulfide interchange protein
MGTHLHASWASAFHLAALMAMGALSATAHAAGTPSPWATGDHSAVRLIAGPSVGATRTAGLEIRLDPGWQTYWKAPGESGAPPVFDWSDSKNVAAVRVSFPVPRRFSDADGVTFGYRDDVILPLAVTPKDPKEAATLAGTVRYAVCGRVCIPVEAATKLLLMPGVVPDAFAAARLEGFSDRVPHAATVGAGDALAIRSVRLAKAGGHPALLAETAAPGDGATLFAAGAGVGVPKRLAPDRWRVPLEHAKGKVELVLADADAAISVPVALDEMAAAP